MCVRLLKENPVPELAEDLDCFTGNEPGRMQVTPKGDWGGGDRPDLNVFTSYTELLRRFAKPLGVDAASVSRQAR